jgi:hypothetical protein
VRRRGFLSLLDILLTDVAEVSHLRSYNPRSIPDTHFCYRLSLSQGHSAAGRMESAGLTINDLSKYAIMHMDIAPD